MATSTELFSTSSSFTLKRGAGNLYGVTVGGPVAGGTVVVADLSEWGGTAPNLGQPSTVGPQLVTSIGPFAASPQPVYIPTYGRFFSQGLSVSLTSTQTATFHYD